MLSLRKTGRTRVKTINLKTPGNHWDVLEARLREHWMIAKADGAALTLKVISETLHHWPECTPRDVLHWCPWERKQDLITCWDHLVTWKLLSPCYGGGKWRFAEITILTEGHTALESWNLNSNPDLSNFKAWALSTATQTSYWHRNVLWSKYPHWHVPWRQEEISLDRLCGTTTGQQQKG